MGRRSRASEPLGRNVREMSDSNSNRSVAAGGGAIYGLGIIGAWVFFFQRADQFWEFVWAFFQGIFWPAFMVYELFKTLVG
jgi:hypothetical protein